MFIVKTPQGEVRPDTLSPTKEETLMWASSYGANYIEEDVVEQRVEDMSNEEVVSTLNWEIVEISDEAVDYIRSNAPEDSNYMLLPENLKQKGYKNERFVRYNEKT